MNTLSYGLLGLLVNESLSGYDLTNRANIFWHTTHSRIYPLLGKLEQEGYVTFSLIRQSDKPDKKIYSLTEKGLNAVKLWLKSPTDAPVTKDEFFFKVYCMHVLDSSGINKLITERENMYRSRIKYCTERIEHLREFYSGKLLTTNTTGFGRYISLKKAISDAENGLHWCTWVRKLYENSSEINIFEYDL
ncbi:PadR family transcriptional regulator [Clostridium sp. 'White wine YQ']|uniref:PadR family transcriptional regulator n=1 Tax=Clostridium sp. 'White wine YQ' TaxID=3027474 RepID=UPI0023671281|nr:PadR family transcriptional regulator [Clostridium sp. 'White wine YQ']MDD7795373.1 PadR family transcriptional regulator [Clostridium sp. 'White wine YQ']